MKLSGGLFRGFLMQARLGSGEGVSLLRAGKFIPDPSWRRQGIQIQVWILSLAYL